MANWFYQNIADLLTICQSLLDRGGAFTRDGVYCAAASGAESNPAGGGEIVAWWGTEIGARRNQSIIPWDYDADFAIFITQHFDFTTVWKQVESALKPLDIVCVYHSENKYRLCPRHPLAWSPWRELYQETKETHPGLARPALLQLVAKASRIGAVAKRPLGCNCIDLEVYTVRPNQKKTE